MYCMYICIEGTSKPVTTLSQEATGSNSGGADSLTFGKFDQRSKSCKKLCIKCICT